MRKRNIRCTYKKGRLSREEKSKIQDWHCDMDIKSMAERLNRPEHQIKTYLDEFLANAPALTAKRSESEEYRRELHASVFWPDIRQQFTLQQIVFYENSYIEYRRQFKDMTTTELKQLYQLITIDIYVSMHNVERRKVHESILELEKTIKKIREKDINTLTQDEMQFLQHNENRLDSLKVTLEKKVDEFADLLKKHEDILKSLKSTRDQRMKTVENQGKFMQVLKELEVASRRKSIGEVVGLMDLAVSKEKDRLGQPHQFKDSMIDLPLLSSDTVNNLDNEENEYAKDEKVD